ncbi:MAG: single-stranded-DNA-specific exonuclease RecJ [OCS116 cluster bacterium]|uniref:Single-stranded-DNA-specific exonuclease RecJ n=1 Tax=OCS116 cluster bacterium TaxID=2030921 RepID=A0A2A4YV77_9PROT|nr:single-stranded-DNA-specific exonuclease RecJ [OCS116 cluster bacterium]
MPTKNGSKYFLDVEKSHLGQKWVARLDRAEEAITIAQKFDIPEILARTIAGRNVEFDEIENYLTPTLRAAMPDPYILQDMELAATRIADAIINGQKIGIIGDYDVDGATSTALILRFVNDLIDLHADGADKFTRPEFYIPDRQAEGYGPSITAVDDLAGKGCELIITVDCGVLAYEPMKYATDQGLDVIILDHHMAEEKLPEVLAVINPNRQDDMSGLGHLAACGVVFVTLVAVNRVLREKHGFAAAQLPNLINMLDLVALGTVCDVVSLTGLNRAFVNQGLKVMGQFGNVGIQSIAEVAQIVGKIEAYHLGYIIGPRINAGGRVGDSRLGSVILSTRDKDEANSIALRLDGYNQDRQTIEKNVLDAAFYQAEQEITDDLPNVIIVSDFAWHQGVIGIVAGRIKEKYNRPTIVIGFDATDGKGSGRSIPGVDLGRAVQKAVEQKLIIKGGGHAMAAGLSIRQDQLAEFRAFMETELSADVVEARKNTSLKIDGALTASAANMKLLRTLETLEPYGTGNARPVFVFPAHHIGFAKIIGKGHLKLSLRSADGSKLDAIAFGAEDNGMTKLLTNHGGKAFHFVGNLKVNRWQGRESVQLQLIDVAAIDY